MQCDVLVAGGGSAGLAAAVTSARTGAKTVLIEHHGSLGGMATASLIHSICGLYRITPDLEPIWANPGFPKEFATRLLELRGARGPVRMGKVDVLLSDPTAFAQLADSLVCETPNLEIRLHSTIFRVASDLGELEIFTRGRVETMRPQTVIDTTGDATVAALAGIAFEQEASEKLQRPAFIFGIQSVAPDALTDEGRLKISRHIAMAVQAGKLTPTALGSSIRASGRAGEAYISIDLSGPSVFDPLDAECLSRLELEGRSTAAALVAFLEKEVTGFAGVFISTFPTRIGIRESRRIIGQYRLETADIENGATFPDAVALATWPMEMRETHKGPKLRFSSENLPCEIPLRALRARDHAHFFMAGRCISTSHEAQASIRVIGTCLATGAAVGKAAAELVK